MTIFLIGYMGAGKSTIGRRLSKVLGYQFVDMDAYVEHGEGMSIADLFATKGEVFFRKAEHGYLKELVALEDTVIALGGGTPCYGNNMQLITAAENSRSIYLKASIPNLVARLLTEKARRPMISHLQTEEDLTDFVGKHLFERSQFYSQCDHIITTDKKSVDEVTEALVMALF